MMILAFNSKSIAAYSLANTRKFEWLASLLAILTWKIQQLSILTCKVQWFGAVCLPGLVPGVHALFAEQEFLRDVILENFGDKADQENEQEQAVFSSGGTCFGDLATWFQDAIGDKDLTRSNKRSYNLERYADSIEKDDLSSVWSAIENPNGKSTKEVDEEVRVKLSNYREILDRTTLAGWRRTQAFRSLVFPLFYRVDRQQDTTTQQNSLRGFIRLCNRQLGSTHLALSEVPQVSHTVHRDLLEEVLNSEVGAEWFFCVPSTCTQDESNLLAPVLLEYLVKFIVRNIEQNVEVLSEVSMQTSQRKAYVLKSREKLAELERKMDLEGWDAIVVAVQKEKESLQPERNAEDRSKFAGNIVENFLFEDTDSHTAENKLLRLLIAHRGHLVDLLLGEILKVGIAKAGLEKHFQSRMSRSPDQNKGPSTTTSCTGDNLIPGLKSMLNFDPHTRPEWFTNNVVLLSDMMGLRVTDAIGVLMGNTGALQEASVSSVCRRNSTYVLNRVSSYLSRNFLHTPLPSIFDLKIKPDNASVRKSISDYGELSFINSFMIQMVFEKGGVVIPPIGVTHKSVFQLWVPPQTLYWDTAERAFFLGNTASERLCYHDSGLLPRSIFSADGKASRDAYQDDYQSESDPNSKPNTPQETKKKTRKWRFPREYRTGGNSRKGSEKTAEHTKRGSSSKSVPELSPTIVAKLTGWHHGFSPQCRGDAGRYVTCVNHDNVDDYADVSGKHRSLEPLDSDVEQLQGDVQLDDHAEDQQQASVEAEQEDDEREFFEDNIAVKRNIYRKATPISAKPSAPSSYALVVVHDLRQFAYEQVHAKQNSRDPRTGGVYERHSSLDFWRINQKSINYLTTKSATIKDTIELVLLIPDQDTVDKGFPAIEVHDRLSRHRARKNPDDDKELPPSGYMADTTWNILLAKDDSRSKIAFDTNKDDIHLSKPVRVIRYPLRKRILDGLHKSHMTATREGHYICGITELLRFGIFDVAAEYDATLYVDHDVILFHPLKIVSLFKRMQKDEKNRQQKGASSPPQIFLINGHFAPTMTAVIGIPKLATSLPSFETQSTHANRKASYRTRFTRDTISANNHPLVKRVFEMLRISSVNSLGINGFGPNTDADMFDHLHTELWDQGRQLEALNILTREVAKHVFNIQNPSVSDTYDKRSNNGSTFITNSRLTQFYAPAEIAAIGKTVGIGQIRVEDAKTDDERYEANLQLQDQLLAKLLPDQITRRLGTYHGHSAISQGLWHHFFVQLKLLDVQILDRCSFGYTHEAHFRLLKMPSTAIELLNEPKLWRWQQSFGDKDRFPNEKSRSYYRLDHVWQRWFLEVDVLEIDETALLTKDDAITSMEKKFTMAIIRDGNVETSAMAKPISNGRSPWKGSV